MAFKIYRECPKCGHTDTVEKAVGKTAYDELKKTNTRLERDLKRREVIIDNAFGALVNQRDDIAKALLVSVMVEADERNNNKEKQ